MQQQKRRRIRQAVLTEDLVERAQTFNPSITRLQMSTVKVPTMESYLATLHRFVSTLRLSTLDGLSPAQLDNKAAAAAFRRAAARAEVHAPELSLHGLRHGGTSPDRRKGERLLLRVQRRGN